MKNNDTKTIVFFYVNMTALGGAETLILRLMDWYLRHSYEVFLLTMHEINNSPILKDLKKINNGEYYIYNRQVEKFLNNGVELSFNTSDVLVLTMSLGDSLIHNKLLSGKKYGCRFIHRMYMIHPHCTTHLYADNDVSKNRYRFKFIIKPLLTFFIKEKIVFFMDEHTAAHAKNSYKIKDGDFTETIIRLPIIIKTDIVSKARNKNVNILGISRFEFPFKGYILGLLDTFNDLSSCFDNLYLTIIGYGVGEDIVNKKIAGFTEDVRKKINLIHQVPYSEINDYIDKCDLFVGMGTTALDAANMNKISIIPVAYQSGDLAFGFFHDNYKNLGAIYDKNLHYFHLGDLIREFLSFDDKSIIEKEDLVKSLITEHYNIDKIAPEIINLRYPQFPLHIKMLKYVISTTIKAFIKINMLFTGILKRPSG